MASYRLSLLSSPPPLERAGALDTDARPTGGIYDHLGGGFARYTVSGTARSLHLKISYTRPHAARLAGTNDCLRHEAIGQAADPLTARVFRHVTDS